ncbi:hypothetical protein PG996_012859 [Apiospora saccharicola]|uniref:Uncharacterized protein n=1 Tax=Apiospora saccharicola TaxID=335842 RepID=A0ABR1U3X8_9PEZI
MDPLRNLNNRRVPGAPTPSLPYSAMASNAMTDFIYDRAWDCLPENGNIAAPFQDTRWGHPSAAGQDLCTGETLTDPLDQSFQNHVSFDTSVSEEGMIPPGTLLPNDGGGLDVGATPLSFLTPTTPYIPITPYGHVSPLH